MAMPQRALPQHPAQITDGGYSSQALLSVQEQVIRAAVRGHGLQSTFELVMNTLSEVVSCDCGVLLSWQVGERNVRVDALSGSHQIGLQAGMNLPVSEAVQDLVCGRLAAAICSDTHIGCNWLNRTMGQMGIGSSLIIALDSDNPARRLLLIGSIKRGQFNSEDAATVGELTGALRASLQDYWQYSDQEIGDQWGRGDASVREHHRLVSELSQGVAHRLSNTFAVLLGKLQLLEDKINNQETVEQLRDLQATVIEGTTILQSLARFSTSKQSNSREIVNLRTLAQEVIDLTRPAWD
ncbi:MAG: HAMP domain-containing histidine kinase, partial [Armatimonadetes bacterium]|nr:HAMP domain-containing histidine kinase [Armatimonadota bacterium]